MEQLGRDCNLHVTVSVVLHGRGHRYELLAHLVDQELLVLQLLINFILYGLLIVHDLLDLHFLVRSSLLGPLPQHDRLVELVFPERGRIPV